jgi:hypothetical protein
LYLGKEGEYERYKRIVRIETAILSEQPVFATELTEDAIGTSGTKLGPIQSEKECFLFPVSESPAGKLRPT